MSSGPHKGVRECKLNEKMYLTLIRIKQLFPIGSYHNVPRTVAQEVMDNKNMISLSNSCEIHEVSVTVDGDILGNYIVCCIYTKYRIGKLCNICKDFNDSRGKK